MPINLNYTPTIQDLESIRQCSMFNQNPFREDMDGFITNPKCIFLPQAFHIYKCISFLFYLYQLLLTVCSRYIFLIPNGCISLIRKPCNTLVLFCRMANVRSNVQTQHSTPKAKQSPTLSTINETNVIQTFLIVSLNIEKDLKILGVFLKLGFSLNLLGKIKEF